MVEEVLHTTHCCSTKMIIQVIASGSKGNCTYIEFRGTKLLIDAGAGIHVLNKALEKLSVTLKEIDGILITHTHKDHTRGLSSILKKSSCAIYVPKEMYKEIKEIVDPSRIAFIDDQFSILKIKGRLIHTSHDAKGSVGYILTCENKELVYITDTGYVNEKYLPIMKNKDVYILESNHDEKMLMEGPYPYILKQRIIGDTGHLSNHMATKYLLETIGTKTKYIVLAHLSEHNNTEKLAYETLENALKEQQITDKTIIIAKQYEPSPKIEV